jgi:hypothetical protein
MVGIEGIGEAVTGGMLARAVEPEHGEAGAHEAACLNCGTELDGPYCHQCGQKAHVHRSLRGFGHDLLHSVFHFEGKIWRTLPMLAWRPGELTRRYVHGERARFVSPIAIFLFSVFLMFAVFSWVGGPFHSNPENSAEAQAEARADFDREQAERRGQLDELRAERQRMAAAGEPTAEIDRRIASQERSIALAQRIFDQTMAAIPGAQSETGLATKTGAPAAREAAPTAAAEGEAKQERPAVDGDLEGAPGWINRAWHKAKANPELLAYKLQSNAYKFSWALIPISVPFVWLLFLHRRRYRQYKAYDHTVFVTYSIAFMSLGLIVLSLLRPLGLPEVIAVLAMTFVPPIHIYRQLKQAYQLRWWSALWRTFVLINFAFIASTLFFLLLVAIGALG